MAPTKTRSGRRRFVVVVTALVGLALGATACGGGSPAGVASLGSTTTTNVLPGGSSSEGDLVGELARYATCMRSHGVPSFPDPATFVGDPKAFKRQISKHLALSPAFVSAQQACGKYAPPQTVPPYIPTQDQSDYLEAARCMRTHGIVGFPDPVFSGGEVRFPIPNGGSINPNSSQFRQARAICELLIPAGLPYSKEDYNGE